MAMLEKLISIAQGCEAALPEKKTLVLYPFISGLFRYPPFLTPIENRKFRALNFKKFLKFSRVHLVLLKEMTLTTGGPNQPVPNGIHQFEELILCQSFNVFPKWCTLF